MTRFTSLFWFSFILFYAVSSMPSLGLRQIQEAGILPVGGILTPQSDHIEIRGVHGGRKKRYILEERDQRQCCADKVCLSILGEILHRDCKCSRCVTGVPALDGKSCADDCPKDQQQNGKGGCCPIGKIVDEAGKKCVDDPDFKRKGRCPESTVLDTKEGPQDLRDPNPKCAIDDEKDCKRPNIPATRPDGQENDVNFKPACGKPDDSKRAKCNLKNEYVHVEVDQNGVATEKCKQNRQYRERKKNRSHSLKDKIKKIWDDEKPQRDAKRAERQANQDKVQQKRQALQEERNKQQQIRDSNDKKKRQMGKCAPAAALMEAVANLPMNRKRDGLLLRDEEETPYDWTTDYFDEDFISSDDLLQYWPGDLNVDEVGNMDIDAEAWMSRWEEVVSAHDLRNNWRPCMDTGAKRSLERRCNVKRSDGLDVVYHMGYTELTGWNSTLSEERTFIGPLPSEAHRLEERNPIAFLLEVAFMGARFAASLLARTWSEIVRYSPRLAQLSEKGSERLFQIAPKGQGGARGGVQAMRNAFQRIANNPNFKQCLRAGKP